MHGFTNIDRDFISSARCSLTMNHCLDSVPHEADQHSRCKHQAQFDNTIYTCKVCWPEDAQHLIIRTLWPRGMAHTSTIRLGHDSLFDHQIGAGFTYWSSDWGMIHCLIIRLGHDSHIDHQIGAWLALRPSVWGMIHILIIRLGHDSHIDHQIGAWLPLRPSVWGMIHILIIRLGHDSHIDHQIGARFTYWSSDWYRGGNSTSAEEVLQIPASLP